MEKNPIPVAQKNLDYDFAKIFGHALRRLILCLIVIASMPLSAAEHRRPISPNQPMWLIHIDTWNYPDPQKIIDLIPTDVRPFVVMNISVSINHNPATGQFLVAEYGHETARSWLRTCAENQMWAMVQQSSGAFQHFPESDLSVYEELYREFPNLIGFNYAEQFWGFDDPNDPLSPRWIDRMAHLAALLKLSNEYGGYLVVSMCWNQWGPSINPIGQMKRSPAFAQACRDYTENYILCEKYTTQSYQSEMESICLGSWLSGFSGHYGIRYDDTGWTDSTGNHANFTMATASAPQLEHMMLTGQTVVDGPEVIWTQCFRETNRVTTTNGFTSRNWETYPQFTNVSVDLFRKVIDGMVRIPSRSEVINRTKFVIVNDVSSGNDNDQYSAPQSLTEGLYRMDGDGSYQNNKSFFKKTGRYPTMPTVFQLDDGLANSFQFKINKSAYASRWPSISSKQVELNNQFPSEYTGDLYAGRHENGWVVYNPFKSGQTASASIPFKYNTSDRMELTFSQYTAAVVKEVSNRVNFYLNNYDNVLSAGLKTDVIRIYGASSQPTWSYADRGSHQASSITGSWSGGVLTLTVQHNGPLDITVNCSGSATGRLTSVTPTNLVAPGLPPTGGVPRQREGECFEYKNIAGLVTSGAAGSIRNYTGQGYLQFGTSSTASVRTSFRVPAAGSFSIETRYSLTGAGVDTIDLYVNGNLAASPTFNTTPSLSSWATYKQAITLNSGLNTIEFRARANASASLHIDNIVVGVGLSDGTYRVVSRHSSKSMDAFNAGTANGTQIIQWTYTGASNQRWNVSHRGNGQYSMTGVQSGRCLEVGAWGTANGSKVQLWDYIGGTNQKMTFSPTGGGYYRISPTHAPSSCIDVSGTSTADGANLHLWQWLGANNQQWSFQAP